MLPTATKQQLHSIRSFGLVTQDLGRLSGFYCDVLGFAVETDVQPIPTGELRLFGVPGKAWRQVLSVGHERIAVEQFETAGRPYPADSNAASLWFQHLALVTADIAEAHRRLRDIAPISIGGPQLLPPSSGGARAFKFRDPDGHPLELLQFPRADVPATWQDRTTLPGQIALGIDHSAVGVRDVERSAAFYAALGLRAGESTVNVGPSQQNLDDLQSVKVIVAPMLPEEDAPHLELLGYISPRGQAGPALRANDVAATRLVWHGNRAELIRDPDGHLHQVGP